MGCKEDLENYLTEHHVPFERQQHPVAYTAQEVASSEHVPGELVAKVVMVMADDRLVMAVLPAPHRLDLAKTKTSLGAEDVRLAREDEFEPAFPDCEVGAMPPFGNLYGLPVWVDTALAEDETIIYQAGTGCTAAPQRRRPGDGFGCGASVSSSLRSTSITAAETARLRWRASSARIRGASRRPSAKESRNSSPTIIDPRPNRVPW